MKVETIIRFRRRDRTWVMEMGRKSERDCGLGGNGKDESFPLVRNKTLRKE